MLIGEYTHVIDAKKRLSLPAKFRSELGKKVVITRGLDKCLYVYPMKQWKEISGKVGDLPLGHADGRKFNRFFLGGAVEMEVDASGRVLISDFQKKFAGIKSRVVVAGLQTHVEVWDEKRWSKYTESAEESADALAEKLAELGIL